MLAASGVGDKHGRSHHRDAAEYEPFLVTQLGCMHTSRLAGRKGSCHCHPGDGKDDSGNNRAGLDSGFAHDPLKFWIFSTHMLLGSAAKGKRKK
jgi:hypothetical protein